MTDSGQVAILTTALVTLATTITTLMYQFVREGRRHQWEIEAARRHAEATARAETERQQIADRVKVAEVNLNAKLDENTAISRQAFTEANHMNAKLADQGAAFDRLLAAALASSDAAKIVAAVDASQAAGAVSAVQATVDATAHQVDDIHRSVIHDG